MNIKRALSDKEAQVKKQEEQIKFGRQGSFIEKDNHSRFKLQFT